MFDDLHAYSATAACWPLVAEIIITVNKRRWWAGSMRRLSLGVKLLAPGGCKTD